MKNIFEEFNAIDDSVFRIMDNEGKIINDEWMPEIDDDALVEAYKNMLFERIADQMTVSYQRQGRIFTYPPNYGQEAIHGATGSLIKEDDWLVPAFRELGVYLAKGVELKEMFLYFMGNEEGSKFKGAKNVLPIAVPITSQLVHAAGIGYALKYQNKKDAVYAFVGDGGTSEGDFHEALNFAGVWKAPVIFVVQNNQYAISVPVETQTASINLAVKSVAYGIKGLKVDGNDFFAMYKALQISDELTRKGEGPVLIEALTYRKGAHTTSDDPTKYRTKEEEAEWDKTDPMKRLKAYLLEKHLWTEEEEEKLSSQFKKEVDRIFQQAENEKAVPLNEIFDHNYVDMPDDIKQQKVEYEKFLRWKEERAKKTVKV